MGGGGEGREGEGGGGRHNVSHNLCISCEVLGVHNDRVSFEYTKGFFMQ